MSLLDLLLQLRGLFAHRSRAALSLLGIVIGSGSIVLLASLMRGGEQALMDASQEATDEDLVAVDAADVPPLQRDKTRRELSRSDEASLSEAEMLRGAKVRGETAISTRAYVGAKKKRVTIVSGDTESLGLYGISLQAGRSIDEDDLRAMTRDCVLGREVAEELFGTPKDALGKHLTIENEVWTIVGVLADKPMLGATDSTYVWNRKVMVPATTLDTAFMRGHTVDRIYVRPQRVAGALDVDPVRGFVRAAILRRHLGVENFKLEDQANSGQEKLILTTIEMLLLSTGFLALLASGINIMNVMLVTVSERTREIGIRRAIGATQRSILAQFVLEAGALSSLGGVIGVFAGLGVAWAAAALARYAIGSFEFAILPWSIALGVGMAFVTGVAFGFFPAWRASRITPIEALRSE